MTEKQKKALEKAHKAPRCSTHCPTWNSWDRDCEIYGENHPSPSKCPYYPYRDRKNDKESEE